jgi:LPS-assembly lipoprotein
MMKKIYLITTMLLTLAAAATLSGCGFAPVYGKHAANQTPDIGIEDHLALIHINTIPDREGQILRNALIDLFHRNGAPAKPVYALTVAPIKETIIDLDITKTADATRGQLRLETSMTITDLITNKTLMTQNLKTISSYNILASEFSNRVSESSTRENALLDLARQIETKTTLYFKREK